MDLTPAQRRTMDGLIAGGAAVPGPEVAVEARDRLEAAVAGVVDGPLWLSKGLLRAASSCEGWFAALVAKEGQPFAHSARTAAGTLMHRAIQADVSSERSADVRSTVDWAAGRLREEDRGFAAWWRGQDSLGQLELCSKASGTLTLFREMFPPLARRWQAVSEQPLRARLDGGAVVLSGVLDLMLGRGARLVLDFKHGEARGSHAEDMRFYALLVTLAMRRAPYRVATVYLESMEWQAEDVTREILEHAAARVELAVKTASELTGGREAALDPGRHCGWCPRRRVCPVSAAEEADDSTRPEVAEVVG